jgi:Uma2 family endonuclease
MSVMPESDALPRPQGVKLTYDDFVHFPDDGMRHELIDGEHYVSPAPSLKHQFVVGALFAALWNFARAHGSGMALVAPFDVLFSQFDVVEPDVLFISKGRLSQILTRKNVQGAPDLAVEVGSPSTRRRDEKLKRDLYERSGVQEYWVADPDLDIIKVYRLVEGRYVRAAELSVEARDVLTTPLLPGLEIPLVDVFEDGLGL